MDYSFEGTIEESQAQMQDLLTKQNIPKDLALWHKPTRYEAEEIIPRPKIGYARRRLDYL
jgi:hypothetical protein